MKEVKIERLLENILSEIRDIKEYNSDTVYTIKTTNSKEANLMMNAVRMAGALYDILCWYRQIYNGKDYDNQLLVDGRLMTNQEYWKYREEKGLQYQPDSDEFVNIKTVYTQEDLEHKLEILTDNIRDLIYEYYE